MKPKYSTALRDGLHYSVGKVADALLPPTKKMIIVSPGRAGSNLLMSFIKSIPSNFQHGEIFGEYQVQSAAVRSKINSAGPIEYLNRRLNRTTTESFTGVKILYRHFEPEYGDKYGIPGNGVLWEHICERDDIFVVHQHRVDKFSMLLSNRLAFASDQWTGGSYNGAQVHMPVDWVEEQLEWLESWELKIAAEVPADRLLDMTYENLTQDTEGELKKFFAFMNVPEVPVQSKMTKQNKKTKAESIDNYDQLRAHFAETRFAPFFNE